MSLKPFLLLIAIMAAGLPAAPGQDAPLAFVGARILPVTGDPIEEGVLVVAGGRILAVGPKGTAVPDGAIVRNLAGIAKQGASFLKFSVPNVAKMMPPTTHLTDLITDELPGSHSNSDPVTGQAGWYDVRVRIRKADAGEPAESAPAFAVLPRYPGMAEMPPREST